MVFKNEMVQKTDRFPEEGTPEFMVAMGSSLKAYDAALDLLIDALELFRDSFLEMVEVRYGLDQYEEFLKDNRAAEKAKEMRPDMAERMLVSEEEREKQEEERAKQKEEPVQPEKVEGQAEEKRRSR